VIYLYLFLKSSSIHHNGLQICHLESISVQKEISVLEGSEIFIVHVDIIKVY